MNINDLTLKIKQKTLEVGFSFCGISKAETLENEAEFLIIWLSEGKQGEMNYMENHFEKRTNPKLLFENAKSVISVLLNYLPEKKIDKANFQIAKYAYHNDYHFVIKSKLNEIVEFIQSIHPEANARAFCDSAPVMDKVWAVKSGLGWMGKNTCLIHPEAGSYYLIGEIITDIELNYDKPIKNHCGNCSKCIDACPTAALTAPYQLDARKCISYLTIEHKSEFEEDIKLHHHIFGCDICQDVCPWNIKFSKPHSGEVLQLNENLFDIQKEDWLNFEQQDFKRFFKNTALERTGYKRLKRNIAKL